MTQDAAWDVTAEDAELMLEHLHERSGNAPGDGDLGDEIAGAWARAGQRSRNPWAGDAA